MFCFLSTQQARSGRQEQETGVQGGVDFSGCVTDPDTGFCCVEKEETVTSLEKEPILECTHKNTEQCHYTYVTQFTPSQEEVCVQLSLFIARSHFKWVKPFLNLFFGVCSALEHNLKHFIPY